LGIKEDKTITSADKEIARAQQSLETRNIPKSIKKWQLPVTLTCSEVFLFVTVATPNEKVPKHSQDEGAGIRFIATGSIIYEGKKLTSGYWMYIPAGKEYLFRVGPLGALMCYCYCCCCA
jgi:hypothetical protein